MKKFADSKDISEYAKEAVKSLQMSGIINGVRMNVLIQTEILAVLKLQR